MRVIVDMWFLGVKRSTFVLIIQMILVPVLFAQTDSLNKKELRKWNLMIDVGTNLSPRVYSYNERMINNVPQFAFFSSTIINRNLNNRWSISTGLGVYGSNFKFEQTATNYFFESNFGIISASGFLRVKETFSYLSAPLGAEYNIPHGRTKHALKFGLRYDLIWSHKEKINFINDSMNIVLNSREYRIIDAPDFNLYKWISKRYPLKRGLLPFLNYFIYYPISNKTYVLTGLGYAFLIGGREFLLTDRNGSNLGQNYIRSNLWSFHTGILF